MSDLKTLVAQEVAKQLAAISADQTTKKVLEFLKNRNSADAYVVETWSDGAQWYRRYSDGWIEQGGAVLNTSTGQTISLNLSFNSTNYFVAGMNDSDGIGWASMVGVGEKASSSFTLRTPTESGDNSQANRKTWFACGY